MMWCASVWQEERKEESISTEAGTEICAEQGRVYALLQVASTEAIHTWTVL